MLGVESTLPKTAGGRARKSSCIKVEGLGFGVWGVGCGVWGVGCGVWS